TPERPPTSTRRIRLRRRNERPPSPPPGSSRQPRVDSSRSRDVRWRRDRPGPTPGSDLRPVGSPPGGAGLAGSESTRDLEPPAPGHLGKAGVVVTLPLQILERLVDRHVAAQGGEGAIQHRLLPVLTQCRRQLFGAAD